MNGLADLFFQALSKFFDGVQRVSVIVDAMNDFQHNGDITGRVQHGDQGLFHTDDRQILRGNKM